MIYKIKKPARVKANVVHDNQLWRSLLPGCYTWDNLGEPAAIDDEGADIQEQDGVAGERDHLDPADTGAEAASLDVPGKSRKVDVEEEEQEADTQPAEDREQRIRKSPRRYDDYYVFD